MRTEPNFQATFVRLKKILQKYERRLTVVADTSDNYYLDAGYSEKFKRTIFFGAVTIKKNYVNFHLMPVYAFSDLLKGISPAIRKRMQGKSCFNFTKIDDVASHQLDALATKGFARFKRKKFLSKSSIRIPKSEIQNVLTGLHRRQSRRTVLRQMDLLQPLPTM